ncbi:MAG: L-threonylcarbamoyladenylate synthase [Candidatus Bathyarchaeia archaeon]
MKTKILKINPRKPRRDVILIAAEVIRRGGTVAFPTETVYGLGADALNPDAVKKIFEAKSRPADNPMIVHVASRGQAARLWETVSEMAALLMDAFWPGPLTLVSKKAEAVPEITVAGMDTVGVRMPDHRVALALIEEAGVPVAAPSANLAGKPSPTLAEHVAQDLSGKIDIILDGGPTRIGLESTVLDLTTSPPTILRPGGVTVEKLKTVLRDVQIHPAAVAEKKIVTVLARSPGMKHRHYAPAADMIVVEGEPDKVVEKVRELGERNANRGKRVAIMTTREHASMYKHEVEVLGSVRDLTTISRNLFKALRELDEKGVDVIIVEAVDAKGLGLAIMNRLRKASDFKIVKA